MIFSLSFHGKSSDLLNIVHVNKDFPFIRGSSQEYLLVHTTRNVWRPPVGNIVFRYNYRGKPQRHILGLVGMGRRDNHRVWIKR